MSLYNDAEIIRNHECLIRTYANYHAGDRFSRIIQDHCGYLNRTECESVAYTVNIKSDMWLEVWTGEMNKRRSKFFNDILATIYPNDWNTRNVSDIKRNIAQVLMQRHSAYGDLVKEEFEYPLSELISDIGGLMGLWMGLSVVGLFEVVELVSKMSHLICVACFTSLKHKDKNPEDGPTDGVAGHRRHRAHSDLDSLDHLENPLPLIGRRHAHPLHSNQTSCGANSDKEDQPGDNVSLVDRSPLTMSDDLHAFGSDPTLPNGRVSRDAPYVEFLYAL